MIGKQIVSEENVPLFQVKEILAERNKEGELSYEQQQAFDYSKKFTKLTLAKGEKLFASLKKIDGLTQDLIVKIVDVLPTDIETMQLVLYKSDCTIDDTKIKEILEIISKYVKK